MKRLVGLALIGAFVVGGYQFIEWYYPAPTQMPATPTVWVTPSAEAAPFATLPVEAPMASEDPAPPAVEEPGEPESPADEGGLEDVSLAVDTGEEAEAKDEARDDGDGEAKVEPVESTPGVGSVDPALLAKADRARDDGDKAAEWEALSTLFLQTSPGEQRATLKGRLDALVERLIFSRRAGPGSELHKIRPGDNLARIAARYNCPKDLIQKINGIADPNLIRAGERIKVIDGHKEIVVLVKPGETLEDISERYRCSVSRLREINVIEEEEPKLSGTIKVLVGAYEILVKKSEFTLTITLNGRYVRQYKVGIGADDRTPTGEFFVRSKLHDPDWTPGSGKVIPAGDPRNILGSRWIGFDETTEVTGIGIHGTTEPETVGTECSAGCVRMINEDVEELTSLTPRGTRVRIVD